METNVNYAELTIVVSERISFEDVIQQYELVREMRTDAPRISSLDALDRKIILDCIREAFEQGSYGTLKEAVQPGVNTWLDRYAGGKLMQLAQEEVVGEAIAD